LTAATMARRDGSEPSVGKRIRLNMVAPGGYSAPSPCDGAKMGI
jgi:hypothetical protein